MDFLFIPDGFHFLVEAKNSDAETWLQRHVVEHDSIWFGSRLFVESRYAYPLAEGMGAEGFQVEGI